MSEPNDLGERALSAAQGILRRGQEVARRETRILRLQTQMSRMRSQRQRLFYQMGQKVFDLFERDLVKNQDLRMMCQQIRGIDAEVELRREEIEQLRRPETRTEGGVDADPIPRVEIVSADEIIRD
jgi:hypothetical protein